MTRLTHCCFYPASSDRGMSVCGYFYSGAGGARFCSAGRKNRGGFMELWEIALTGLSLAMDAFAVSMCKGVEMKKFILKYTILIVFSFGIQCIIIAEKQVESFLYVEQSDTLMLGCCRLVCQTVLAGKINRVPFYMDAGINK